MSRTVKRTPEIDKKLTQALELGNTRRASCAYASISEDTLQRWIKRFADFAALIAGAESKAEIRNVGTIQKAASERTVTTTREKILPGGDRIIETRTETVVDWRAAAWWLARRRPEAWGKEVNLSHLSDDDLRAILEGSAEGDELGGSE